MVTLIAATMVVCGAGVFVYATSEAAIPDKRAAVEQQSAVTFLSADRSRVLAVIQPPGGARNVVDGKDIAQTMKNAIVSAEDRTFYEHLGFAPQRIAAAALGHARGRSDAGGGSTITQQLIKNTVGGDEYSLTRKIKEVFSAARLSAAWTKDDVLTTYLNLVYFGRGALGVEQAAQTYFGIHASQLDNAQAAFLAGLVQSPSGNDPAVDEQAARERFEYVTYQMHRNGYLSDEEYDAISFPKIMPPSQAPTSMGLTNENGHIVSMALAELAAKHIDKEELFASGATVVTSIVPAVQDSVVSSARNASHANNVRVAAAAVNPETGGIEGIYGGDDGLGFNYANEPQMTGSTSKIFALAAGLEQGIGLGTQISSEPYVVGSLVLNNSDGMTCGTCSLAEATKQSLNTSFYRLQDMLRGGPADTRDMAHRLGVESPLSEEDGSVNRSVVLGAYGATMVDMAEAMGTIANGGTRSVRHIVNQVTTRHGRTLYAASTKKVQVISPMVAADIDRALEPIPAYSRGHALAGKIGYGKTGTVQLGDTGENRDALMVGYTRRLAVAVWVGTDNGRPLRDAHGAMIWGASLPADVWKQILDQVG